MGGNVMKKMKKIRIMSKIKIKIKIKKLVTAILCGGLASLWGGAATAKDHPNIVYIALEDITPMMGCYGDTYATTPVFDKLAAEGIRYTHAYSVGPVCSVSRSSIVTGMYPTTLGTHHHRSNVGRPPAFLATAEDRPSEQRFPINFHTKEPTR